MKEKRNKKQAVACFFLIKPLVVLLIDCILDCIYILHFTHVSVSCDWLTDSVRVSLITLKTRRSWMELYKK